MYSQEQPENGAKLPPKPDPETGRPRPPRAPVDTGSGGGSGSSERNERHKPSPPPGQARTLEWFKASRRRSIVAGIGGSVAILGGTVILTLDSKWLSMWWVWLIAISVGLLVGSSIRVSSCAAGAEWFAVGNNWVDLYNLSSVEVKAPTHYREIILKDRSGRQADYQLMDIQENQDLWDLVYNGILHSVVKGGAETNTLGQSALKLPPQPHHLPSNRHDQ